MRFYGFRKTQAMMQHTKSAKNIKCNKSLHISGTHTRSAAPGRSDPYAPTAPLPDLLKACTGSIIPLKVKCNLTESYKYSLSTFSYLDSGIFVRIVS